VTQTRQYTFSIPKLVGLQCIVILIDLHCVHFIFCLLCCLVVNRLLTILNPGQKATGHKLQLPCRWAVRACHCHDVCRVCSEK